PCRGTAADQRSRAGAESAEESTMGEYARPAAGEYADYYAAYVRRVPPGPILTILERQLEETLALLRPLDEEQAGFRYAPGKWSIREVVGHIVDTERIFGVRALWFARG